MALDIIAATPNLGSVQTGLIDGSGIAFGAYGVAKDRMTGANADDTAKDEALLAVSSASLTSDAVKDANPVTKTALAIPALANDCWNIASDLHGIMNGLW